MGITNHGNQRVTPVSYYHEIVAETYGHFLQDVLPVGIYTGGWLGKISDSVIELSPLTCVISDGEHLNVIHTTESATLSNATLDSGEISSAYPFVVLRWSFDETPVNYMEVHTVSTLSNLGQNDLVVGKCLFSGGSITGFDYTYRNNPRTLLLMFKPEQASGLYIRVRGGRANTLSGSSVIGDQLVGPFSLPTAPNSRIDLVYLDTDGSIKILQGSPSISPVPPNYGGRIPIAEVRINYGDSSIPASQITDVRTFLPPKVLLPDDNTIGFTSGGLIEVKDVFGNRLYESDWFAVQGKKTYTLLHNLGSTRLFINIYFAPALSGSPDLSKITQVDTAASDSISKNTGGIAQNITSTQLQIGTYTDVASRIEGGTRVDYSSGFYKVVALRV